MLNQNQSDSTVGTWTYHLLCYQHNYIVLYILNVIYQQTDIVECTWTSTKKESIEKHKQKIESQCEILNNNLLKSVYFYT